IANVCVNAQPIIELLTNSGSSSQMPYGVWPYRLMINGIFGATSCWVFTSLAGRPESDNKLQCGGRHAWFSYRRRAMHELAFSRNDGGCRGQSRSYGI